MSRDIFVEDWWLEAATDSQWSAVTVLKEGRVVGWLPYARSRRMGFPFCGQVPLVRLLYPQISLSSSKPESLDRERFHVECELIDRLPQASCHRFMLPPHAQNALAWQARGFSTRLEHTFIVEPHLSDTDRWHQMRNKTRSTIRRAAQRLQVLELGAPEFSNSYAAVLGNQVTPFELAATQKLVAAAIARRQGRALSAVGPGGRIHASVLFVWDSTDYYYFLSARQKDDVEPGAVAMLVWEGLQDAWRRGLRFDFDGVSSQGRLHFMQGFGGRLASRLCVERASTAYAARLLLRQARQRMRIGTHPPSFS